ncbi:MAG: hypothetical protein JWM14_1481 [Chitinophagaceae bacterium]|nr:hypothetical protein [Chitinophagaceae bacterium]
MKKTIKYFSLLIFIGLLTSFTTSEKKHLGKWEGKDKDDIGYILFEKEGYATFLIDGQSFGGKEFTMKDKRAQITYTFDYKQTPIPVDFIITDLDAAKELGRLKGIVEFESDTQMKFALEFDAKKSRPTSFGGPNTIVLTKVK